MTNNDEGCIKKHDNVGGGGSKITQNCMMSFMDDPQSANPTPVGRPESADYCCWEIGVGMVLKVMSHLVQVLVFTFICCRVPGDVV